MNKAGIITIIDEKCKRCYVCQRKCPTKALKTWEDGRQHVVDGICISCGTCVSVCTQGARVVRDDTHIVIALLKRRQSVIALLDPSFPAAFPAVQPGQVMAGLKALGFSSVYLTSPVATLIILQYKKALQAARDTVISSICPAVVGLVTKHFPDLVPMLAPVVSVPAASMQLLRAYTPPGTRIVFIGPCASNKLDAEPTGETGATSATGAIGAISTTSTSAVSASGTSTPAIDAAITFGELKGLFSRHEIYLDVIQPLEADTFPGPAQQLHQYDDPRLRALSLPGGFSWLLGICSTPFANDLVVACGKERCLEVMTDLARGKLRPRFIDALFCRGCIDAPGMNTSRMNALGLGADISLSERRKHLCAEAVCDYKTRPPVSVNADAIEEDSAIAEVLRLLAPGLERRFSYCGVKLPVPNDKEIANILAFCDKADPEKQLNCGLCGYPTCRDRAIAVYQGLTRDDACIPYLIDRMRNELKANEDRRRGLKTTLTPLDQIYGSSDAINKAKVLAVRAAQGDSTVLIIGESGTGKEVFARAIHAMSQRREGPLVSVNCAAIPDTLMESELFGYVDGAFTGAVRGGKPGKFELANGGTIFLDEIGDMPSNLQAKLLRVLQERTVERVGGIKTTDIDVRIIAATNQDLTKLVKEQRFRMDLYYRLNVMVIYLPPLRERLEDIPAIIRRSLTKLNERCGTQVHSVSPDAMKVLLTHDWPGNIRELENVLERALNMVDGDVIRPEHLPEYIIKGESTPDRRDHLLPSDGETLDAVIARLERETLLKVLKTTGGNKVRAARRLGISRSTLYEKLSRFNLV